MKHHEKVFVNRSVDMRKIKAIGFDMDHTLAVYDHQAFEKLAFEKTLEKLIEAGYPKQLKNLAFDPHFIIRGLLLDRKTGNLLKVDSHRYVKKAMHGKELVDYETRRELYNHQHFRLDHCVSADSYFALSEMQLYAEVVEYMRLHPNEIKKSFDELYLDIRQNMDLSHADGSIKEEVVTHLETYVKKDPNLVKTLKRLRDSGKRLFLLTNSGPEYTDQMMRFLTDKGDHWPKIFDFINVSSRKPDFFKEGSEYEILGEQKIYKGGNAEILHQYLGVSSDEILYVGDHMYGDIIRSKSTLNWRTMLIIDELDGEIEKMLSLKNETKSLETRVLQIERLEEAIQRKKTNKKKKKDHEAIRRSVTELHEAEAELKALIYEIEKAHHEKWGPLMKAGTEKSRFADQVERYACLYTSKFTNMRFYSPVKRYFSPFDQMPHDF